LKFSSNNDESALPLIELEGEWADAIQRQDMARASYFLADTFFLAIGVEGLPLQIVKRDAWLQNLKWYQINSFRISQMRVDVYGDVAVVVMLYNQIAKVRGSTRSGQFFLTDVWTKKGGHWKVAQRQAGRPEPKKLSRPR
jgi:ketosteroid isomerase-like protein